MLCYVHRKPRAARTKEKKGKSPYELSTILRRQLIPISSVHNLVKQIDTRVSIFVQIEIFIKNSKRLLLITHCSLLSEGNISSKPERRLLRGPAPKKRPMISG